MDACCKNTVMPDIKFKIKSLVSSNFSHVVRVHPHWHPEVEILFFINGCAKQQVNDRFFIARPGDIVIIGKDQLHSTYTYEDSNCDILVIMFDAANIFEQNINGSEQNPLSVYGNSVVYNNPVQSSGEPGKSVLDCITGIHEELTRKKCAYPMIIKSLLYKMSGLFTRNGLYEVANHDIKSIKIARQMLSKTFALIDDHYFSEISLKRAADVSNLSVPHFCRLFKKTTGMTFNDYLAFYRVNHAERMLGSNKTLAGIAFDCGFGSVSSFIRNFKKYKKCTPSTYKRVTGDGSLF